MSADSPGIPKIFPFLYLAFCTAFFSDQMLQAAAQAQPAAEPSLVSQALAHEIESAQGTNHPMRYLLRKSSSHLISTKEIAETRDGEVARLVSINDQPLSPDTAQQEEARLDQILADPGRQHHRKQSEDADTSRALKVLRALPTAFIYEDIGAIDGPAGTVENFSFHPNPAYSPPDLETQILTQMSGSLWVDPVQKRVVRLEGHLQQDVDFGWGILGRLNKGGWITIEQADVGGGLWRTVRFQMVMSGRVVFRTRSFDTTEEESHFTPLPTNIDYRQAIQLLRSEPETAQPAPGQASQ